MPLFRSIRAPVVSNEPPALEVTHAGDTYRIVLRRVRGARRFTLRVRNATADVVLTMPLRGSVNAARAFAESHAAWIGARLRRVPQAAPFEPGVIIPLRGMDHQIQHRPGARGNVWVEAHPTPDESAALALCVAGERPHVARRVSDHLKHLARQDLQAAVAAHCAKLDLRPKSITLRDPVSRWGSCSSAGALSFSWRLILAPAFVLDYLAAHEAAHLVHMNHSPKFWALVNQLTADTQRAEAWLNAHGPSLHRYGKTPQDRLAGDPEIIAG